MEVREVRKMLILSPHNPFLRSSGGENRIYLIMRELAKQNRVILFCPTGKKENLPNIDVYQVFEDKAKNKLLNLAMAIKLKDIIKKESPEVIQLEFPWQAINLWLIGQKYNLVAHNVEFIRFKRSKSFLWPIIFLYEILACQLAKKVICVSDKDKIFFVRYLKVNISKIEVMENPVDKTVFFKNKRVKDKVRKELGLKEGELFIMFFGQLNYVPNSEALYNIKNEIIPRLEQSKTKYKIVICGKGDGRGLLKSFEHKNLLFKGFVEKIQDYINASDVIIAPFNSGSGTRIKILEALACHKRVISTSVGAEGVSKNQLLVIEDDWDNFVNKLVALYQ
jgi:polysaccharide biosynthesis protein PslH